MKLVHMNSFGITHNSNMFNVGILKLSFKTCTEVQVYMYLECAFGITHKSRLWKNKFNV